MSRSPFTTPELRCGECGRESHEGRCDPLFDAWVLGVVVLTAVIVGLIYLAV